MANNPYDQFDKVSSTVSDLGAAFGIGSNQLLRMAGDLYGLAADDMDNAVSRQAAENIEYLQKRKSPELIEAERARKKATDLEEDELSKALTFFRETAKNPLLAATASAESVPSLVGAGGAGAVTKVAAGKLLARKGVEKAAEQATKAGVAAAVGTGAAMQGTSTAGEQYRTLVELLNKMPDEQAAQLPQIKRLMEEKEASLPEAKAALALDLARSTGILSGAASVATQMVPGGRAIEKTLVGGPAKRVLSRAAGAVKGAAGEALQEAAEEGSGTIIQNIMAEPVEPGREITKGLGESVAAATIGAAPLGAAAGAAGAGGATQSPQPAPEVETTAGKSEEAPASAATRERLTEQPRADLTRSEEMSPEEFWASVNVRHANLMGGQPSPEDVQVAGGVAPAGADIDPEKSKQALDMGSQALASWRESNPSAPENIVLIYDPEMLHNGYGVQGAYNRRNGGILINTAFVTPERIGAIVNHEWAHATLATAEGQQALAKFAEDALKRVDLGGLQSRYGQQDPIILLEEWIAENQEKAPSVIRDIVARIREWLAQFNIVDLNDGEVADIMLRTLRELESNKVQPDIDVTGIETEGQTPETAYSLAQTEAPEFKQFFGDSKVVDAQNKPLRVYHGTRASFDEFRVPAMFHVSRDYAQNLGDRIVEAYLSIKNPADLRQMHLSPSDPQFAKIAKELQAQGYDGAQYRNEAYIAFSPSQIRTAETPDTRFSLSEQPIAKGRDTVLARAAQGVKAGEVTPKEYNRMVNKRMPLEPFEEVPTPATDDEVLLGLGDLMAGDRRKRDLKANPEDIEGQQVEARLDIPAYESKNVWVVTLHQPRQKEGAAGTVLAYTPTAVLKDVTFSVNETAALNVAGGKRKSSFATMNGEYVPMTARSAYEMANEAKDSGDWVEVGMNPIRHSYFYDKSDQRPVVSAEEVIQVGGMVLARGVEYGEKGDYKYSLAKEPQNLNKIEPSYESPSKPSVERSQSGVFAAPELSGQPEGGRPERGGAGDRVPPETVGRLSPLRDAPAIKGATGPDPRIVEVAERYARDNGIDLKRQAEYVDVNPEFAARVAQAYEEMPHAPSDPEVREAYNDLIRQTRAQYDALVDAGYRFYFYDSTNDPYAGNPFNAIRDLRENQKMAVYATGEGFGSSEEFDPEGNPLLADTGLEWGFGSEDGPKRRVTANDLFRAVHDAFGHSMEGAGFRARGEENAWQAHRRLFAGPAVGAMTSETRGQNSWLNYGPAAEKNRTAKVEDTVFADQKTGLMPEWTWTENVAPDISYSLTEEAVPEEGDEQAGEEFDPNSTLGAAAQKNERDDLPPTSALNTLYAKQSSVPLPTQGKRTNGQVAEQLRQAARQYWGREVNASNITPEERDRLVENGVEEVIAGLKASNHAGNWYTTAIRKAMAIATVLHPELKDDALAQKAGFRDAYAAEIGLAMAMAITSQNLNVEKNTQYANEQFEILKKTGRFDPSKIYGSKGEAISGNLQLANTLLDKVGWEGVEDFLNREYKVKDLNEIATQLLGREISISGKVDDVVNGSSIFGPKIGGGFFQNLRANFNPVTVDLWMRRTWGRWTGDVLPEPLDATRLARMLVSMREAGIRLPEEFRSVRTVLAKKGRKVPTLTEQTAERILSDPKVVNAAYDFAAQYESRWNKIYSEVRRNITPEQAEAVRKGSLSLEQLNQQQQESLAEKQAAWQALENRPSISSKEGKEAQKQLFDRMDQEAGRTAVLTNKELSKFKPEWAKAARVVTTLLKPVDVPSDLDRRVIVDVVNRIRNELDRRGVTATNADIQAILWYPEKDLWAKLAGRSESKLKSSYDEEFLRVAESQGLGEQARRSAEDVRD